MPPPDSTATITTAASIKGPLADSNPDLDEAEPEKASDKIKSSDYKKLTKQIAQLNKTVEALKKDKEGLLEERHNLKSANKTLEKEVKHLTSSLDSCRSELEHLKHSKDKKRPQQDHTSEAEEKVKILEAALARREVEVATLQKKLDLQDRMLGQIKTDKEEQDEVRVGANKTTPPEDGRQGPQEEEEEEEGTEQQHFSEQLRREQETNSKLRSELADLKAKYQVLEAEVVTARAQGDPFAVVDAVPQQIKGTPVPRVRSHSLTQVSRDQLDPVHLQRQQQQSPTPDSPTSPSRRVPHGSPYLSPRHVVSHAVVPPPPQRSRSPSVQVDISMLQNCMRQALEEKKISDQRKEELEEELFNLQATMEVHQANAGAAQRLAQVDMELGEAREKLEVVAAEKAALEGKLDGLQRELQSVLRRSSQVEGEMVRAAAEREAQLRTIGEQNDRLTKEVEVLKLAIGSRDTENGVTGATVTNNEIIAPASAAESLKITPTGIPESPKVAPVNTSESQKTSLACIPESVNRGTECQTDPPTSSTVSPQSPQRSAVIKMSDKQKVSNRFVNMRAVFEGTKTPGEEGTLVPTRRHSASLTKERTAPEDSIREEERAATLPGVYKKDHSPEPKGKTTPLQSTSPPQTTPLPQTTPSSASLQTLATQSVPLARTTSPSPISTPIRSTPPTPTQAGPHPQVTSSMQACFPQAQTIQSTPPTQIITTSYVTQTATPSQTTPSAQATPSAQTFTPPQIHAAPAPQKIPVARIASPFYTSSSAQPAASSNQKVPTSGAVPPSTAPTQGTVPPSATPTTQGTVSPSATPTQATTPSPATPQNPSTQSTTQSPRAAYQSPQGITSPSRAASQTIMGSAHPTLVPTASVSAEAQPTAASAMHDLKGVPLTRVLTPTTRQGEQSPSKVTSPQRDSIIRTDSRDQLASPLPTRTNLSPTTPIKTSTAIITVQKKEQAPQGGSSEQKKEQAPQGGSSEQKKEQAPQGGSSEQKKEQAPQGGSSEQKKEQAPQGGSSEQKKEQAPQGGSSEQTLKPAGIQQPPSLSTSAPATTFLNFEAPPTPGPTHHHRGIVKAERFTVRASSPLYQQGTAELKQATVAASGEGGMPTKAPPTTTAAPSPTPSPVTSTSTASSPSPTSSVQLRGPHKRVQQRPMSYCPQSSSTSSNSSANLSGLISRLQEEGPTKASVAKPTSSQMSPAFMRVASWAQMAPPTPAPASKPFATVAENGLVIILSDVD